MTQYSMVLPEGAEEGRGRASWVRSYSDRDYGRGSREHREKPVKLKGMRCGAVRTGRAEQVLLVRQH